MQIDRRHFLATGGALLTGCQTTNSGAPQQDSEHPDPDRLDRLLAAHAEVMPENAGGTNHYTMAAEALEAMGHEAFIAEPWHTGAALYPGSIPRHGRLTAPLDALGHYDRFGDWRDFFTAEIERSSWRSTVRRWVPRLAPALAAAMFHGVLRTAHAVRALRHRDSAPRRHELAIGLAYWAARYAELPAPARPRDDRDLVTVLATLQSPWRDDPEDVDFHHAMDRLTTVPLATIAAAAQTDRDPAAELNVVVRAAATGFLEMLVAERNRIWLLHTVTGPAAAGLLLPELDRNSGARLIAYARQAVVATFAAYGVPFTPGAHVRASTASWPVLAERAARAGSVHGIKLIEALRRSDHGGDLRLKSVAAQWFEWV